MNSTGKELHPNWRALTTLHVPLKCFVHASTTERVENPPEKHLIKGISGDEAQQFYKEVLEVPITKLTVRECPRSTPSKVKGSPQLPFDKNTLYRLATSNNAKELSKMCIVDERQLNSCDAFGWTALMMAACEGAEDTVMWLLQLGADVKIMDKSGNTALDLARRKGHETIIKLLEHSYSVNIAILADDSPTEESARPFYCIVCQRDYKESSWRAHQTSTVHQFNIKSTSVHRLQKFNISAQNRGLQLMVKQGWDREHGLGPTLSGRLYPVKTVLRKQRTGLGVQQAPARVTHFQAFDTNATRYRYRNPNPLTQQAPRTREKMKQEKLRDWKRERRLRNELS